MTKITTQMPCANRCVLGPEDEPELAPATHGAYCDREYLILHDALKEAPMLVEHIVSMLAHQSTAGGDKVDGPKEPPAPLNVNSFDDANELYSLLVYWSMIFAELLHVEAPAPARYAWRSERGTIIGLPNDVGHSGARYTTGVMANWIDRNLDTILGTAPRDDINLFTTNIADVYRIAHRWPRKDKPRKLNEPCPGVDCAGKLVVYPPREQGDEQRILCGVCGRHVIPVDYEAIRTAFQEAQKEQVRTEKVVKHLAKKYQIGA